MTAAVIISLAGITFGWFLLGPPDSQKVIEKDFKFIKNEKHISLSGREINLKDGRTTRELKAEFLINANIQKVVSAVKSDKLSRQWMQEIEEYSIISRESDNKWKAYIQYKIPWPLSNQDCIIGYNCIVSDNGNTYVIKMTGLPSYLPKKEGVERIAHLSGSWTINRVTDQTCRVIYTIYTEQKPRFPRWATDPIVQQNLINTMSSLKELMER